MDETGKIRNPVILVTLAAAVLAAASIVLLIRQYNVEVDNAQIQLLAKGRTTLDALAAGIRAQSRRGMYRADRLADIFDELAQTPGILALQLRSASGAMVAAGGDLAEVPPVPPDAALWEPQRLHEHLSGFLALRVRPGSSPARPWRERPGTGPPAWRRTGFRRRLPR